MRVKVDKLGINGEGVIRSTERDVKVCFVDYCLPGEIVDIDIVDAKKHFNIARLNDVIQSSRDRVLPKCPYFYECGGCNLMHMNIDIVIRWCSLYAM